MHIGLNLLFLVPEETGGLEVYARELIPALARAAPEARFTAFVNREAAAAGVWDPPVETVTIPVQARRRTEWVRGEQQLLPPMAAKAGVDVLHSLASTAPAWGSFRRVVTIHDLNYRIVPEAHLGLRGLGMRVLVPLAARRSHRILAPTASTREDVVRLLRIPASKVDVVHEGLGWTGPADPPPEAEVRDRLGLGDRPLVLSVSAKRPHKNLIRLLGALALIPAERRPVLVLPGYPTSFETVLRREAERLGVDGSVRWLGWVGRRELEGLYAAASCFVFPSLYEGFGLPVLEAMARGVPVACSGRGALEEVAGEAALKFDPESVGEIAASIERLLSDRDEAERLRVAGIARASRFSWSTAAAETLASYERVLASS